MRCGRGEEGQGDLRLRFAGGHGRIGRPDPDLPRMRMRRPRPSGIDGSRREKIRLQIVRNEVRPAFRIRPEQHEAAVLEALQDHRDHAVQRSSGRRRHVRGMPSKHRASHEAEGVRGRRRIAGEGKALQNRFHRRDLRFRFHEAEESHRAEQARAQQRQMPRLPRCRRQKEQCSFFVIHQSAQAQALWEYILIRNSF